MKKLFYVILALAVLFFIFGRTENQDDVTRNQTVILISVDGFRADYIDLYPSSNIIRLIERGVKATSLIPAHPTKTFPNHYSIVTGLYPSNHGIVANVMYDSVFDETFKMSKREEVENARWWEGEPLWVTAEKQGVPAATYFWPGSEAAIQNVRPSYWKRYDGTVPGNERVDEVLSWLQLPEQTRPRFITLYFSDVDSKGHRFGPVSDETADAVQTVDTYIGRLLEGLEKLDVSESVNIVLVSDHGMAQSDMDKVIFLDDYVDAEDFYAIETTPVLMLNSKPGKLEKVYNRLVNAHPSLTVYKSSEYPADWHWTGHRRIPELVAVADEGWSIASSRGAFDSGEETISAGVHGYDRNLASMQSIFIGSGPAFREGEVVPAFENIHIYPLIAHILELEPATVDGSLDEVKHLLKDGGN